MKVVPDQCCLRFITTNLNCVHVTLMIRIRSYSQITFANSVMSQNKHAITCCHKTQTYSLCGDILAKLYFEKPQLSFRINQFQEFVP